MINKIKINDFRGLKDKTIQLGKYLTIISGKNATGKSTILGMLGNAGELKKKDAKTYTGGHFRADFNELFKGSMEYDLTGSDKYEVILIDDNREKSDYRKFRVSWQSQKGKTQKRFRLIPYKKKSNGKITNTKFQFPVIHLGLSRLFPIGEVDSEHLQSENIKFMSDDHRDWFITNYEKILSMEGQVQNISNTQLKGIKNKKATGIKTNNYDHLANSAGQDNVGQILLALLSFKANEQKGGLLLIDEFDATLHPVAQEYLFTLLIRICRELSIQIVLTTHSTTLLELVMDKIAYNKEENFNKIELYYFTKANKELIIHRNPEYRLVYNDLHTKAELSGTLPRIKVYSEDAESRWMINHLLRNYDKNLNILDVSIGCSSLLSLCKADPEYFGSCVIVLDSDVSNNFVDTLDNIVKLPGDKRPEEVIYNYLLSLDAKHQFLIKTSDRGFSNTYFKDRGPQSDEYSEKKEREKYKHWFLAHQRTFDEEKLFEYWEKDNKKIADKFIEDFNVAYNSVKK